MDVLLASEITPAMLVSTNAPERLDGQVEWTDQAWPAGSVVTRTATRRVYRAAYDVPAGSTPPEENIATAQVPFWTSPGPMSQWGMFDGVVKSQTEGPVGNLVVVLRPGVVTDIWLSNLDNVNAVRVQVLDKPGGSVIYDERRELASRFVYGWWDYWFEPFSLLKDAPFQGIPVARRCEITITAETSGSAKIGMAALGKIENLGRTEWGVESKFNNYSARNLNSPWGPTQATEGEVTKDISYRVFVKPKDAPRVARFMKKAMRQPAVFIPSGQPELEDIRIFGQAVSAELGRPHPNYVPLDITVREFI